MGIIKSNRFFLITACNLLIAVCCCTAASSNYRIQYNGFLQINGAPVNGTKGFVFRIKDGSGGAVQWQSQCTDVAVTTGVFKAVIGETNDTGNWNNIDWQSIDAYLEILVGAGGDCSGQALLTSPERLMSSPYVIIASSTTGLLSVDGKLKVTSSTVSVNGTDMFFVSSGTIALWSGNIATIPAGWALCNGTNGTPDLRDRFVICASTNYAVGSTGGAVSHTHTIAGHTHDVNIGSFSSGGSNAPINIGDNDSGPNTRANGHTHPVDPPNTATTSTGITTDSTTALPPYYALAYIMKM